MPISVATAVASAKESGMSPVYNSDTDGFDPATGHEDPVSYKDIHSD